VSSSTTSTCLQPQPAKSRSEAPHASVFTFEDTILASFVCLPHLSSDHPSDRHCEGLVPGILQQYYRVERRSVWPKSFDRDVNGDDQRQMSKLKTATTVTTRRRRSMPATTETEGGGGGTASLPLPPPPPALFLAEARLLRILHRSLSNVHVCW